ncbi:MAG: DUF4440 domain-containing protein [Gammaproteobacteria bacterium]|nr:DUF4440 domain-containing protein [Gammaproteobacteria bacterium]|tara:strand:+ start:433 stop:840 length:408 start_codon:yes stop_codon:yes gene_type:complete
MGTVEDRLAVRELIEAYNDAVMRFDAEAWIANWNEDATWRLPGLGELTGREAILAAWQAAMSEFEFVGFFASAGPLSIDTDTGAGRWFQQEFLHYRDGRRRDITGRYEDLYVKENGAWQFARRDYEILTAREWQA